MFTGIIEELGTVVSLEDQGDAVRLTVQGPLVTSDARPGDSIAVNGCCLTVVALDPAGADAGSFTDHSRSTATRTRAPSPVTSPSTCPPPVRSSFR